MYKFKLWIGCFLFVTLFPTLNYWNCSRCVVQHKKNIHLYTVYHKHTPIFQNDIVIPIQAGRALHTEQGKYLEDKIIGDDTGDNISLKNKTYAELTAMYWIWKNDHDADYIGLMHYRRLFAPRRAKYSPHNIYEKFGLTHEYFDNLVDKYDIILSRPSHKSQTLFHHYVDNHYKEDILLVLSYIREKYPEMWPTVRRSFIESYSGYFCNVFVMKRDAFEEYATWLFDILFALEDKLDPQLANCKTLGSNGTTKNNYQARVSAYLAERLLNIWVEHNRSKYRVGEIELVKLSFQ